VDAPVAHRRPAYHDPSRDAPPRGRSVGRDLPAPRSPCYCCAACRGGSSWRR
jgi:hypothetical protein